MSRPSRASCTTRIVKDLNKSTINGRGFHPRCTADERRSDLLARKNPTCDVATYVGGMECCRDNDVLLDADQEQPAHVDEVHFKWRFYHEPYDAAAHTPVVHLEWAVNGCDSGGQRGGRWNCAHIEFDTVQAPKGTPPHLAVHEVTSHFKTRDMLSPTCDPAVDEYCANEKLAEARGGAVRLVMAVPDFDRASTSPGPLRITYSPALGPDH